MKLHHFFFISITVFLTACDQKPKVSENLQIIFGEKEQETEQYQTRVIVTPEFMRFDDGEGAHDFVLFDRKNKIIYSVTTETKQIMMVEDSKTDIPPQPGLKLNKDIIKDTDDYPTLAGKKPVHYKFKSGDEACFETLSIKGFLPAYVAALKEFNALLAKDSMATLIS
ncbi:MAG: hypothetical protein OEY00_08775, partial [Gammaproteobacteria bacterium]|nr:hypothetical protein [Gammaproteobacteria bacterium]